MKMFVKKKEKKIKNNCFKNATLIKQLIMSKNQYGCLNKYLKPENKAYIYGLKHKQNILNVEQTCIGLKRMLFLIQYYLKKTGTAKILLICTDYQKKKFDLILTQNKTIARKIEIAAKWKKGVLNSQKNEYNLIILFSSPHFEIIKKEVEDQKFPLISFVNTDILPNPTLQINYPIFYNNKKFESIYFMFMLLLNCLKS